MGFAIIKMEIDSNLAEFKIEKKIPQGIEKFFESKEILKEIVFH